MYSVLTTSAAGVLTWGAAQNVGQYSAITTDYRLAKMCGLSIDIMNSASALSTSGNVWVGWVQPTVTTSLPVAIEFPSAGSFDTVKTIVMYSATSKEFRDGSFHYAVPHVSQDDGMSIAVSGGSVPTDSNWATPTAAVYGPMAAIFVTTPTAGATSIAITLTYCIDLIPFTTTAPTIPTSISDATMPDVQALLQKVSATTLHILDSRKRTAEANKILKKKHKGFFGKVWDGMKKAGEYVWDHRAQVGSAVGSLLARTLWSVTLLHAEVNFASGRTSPMLALLPGGLDDLARLTAGIPRHRHRALLAGWDRLHEPGAELGSAEELHGWFSDFRRST
jgi:hypothetical protein